jgi:hypothetical protein
MSINGVGPPAPSSETGATSVIGSRRRAAAIASPSRVCAFSRTSSSLRAWSQVSRSTIGGTAVLVLPVTTMLLTAPAQDHPSFVETAVTKNLGYPSFAGTGIVLKVDQATAAAHCGYRVG